MFSSLDTNTAWRPVEGGLKTFHRSGNGGGAFLGSVPGGQVGMETRIPGSQGRMEEAIFWVELGEAKGEEIEDRASIYSL